MCRSSIAHAVAGSLGEHSLQLVTVGLEARGHGLHARAVLRIARTAEAHVLEHFLHLAGGERIAARELSTQGLRAGALAGERAVPAEQRVLALAPVVVP